MTNFTSPSPGEPLEILHPLVEAYLRTLQFSADPLLSHMETYAEQHGIPIIDPLVGRLLSQLVRSINAKLVVELGSAIGYSTIWLARSVDPQAKVWFVDRDPGAAEVARPYMERAKVLDRMEFFEGEALDFLESFPDEADLVFCDIDKHQYAQAFDLALPKIRTGGLFVADNSLWQGRILSRSPGSDAECVGIRRFNELTHRDPRVATVLLPIGDGVTVCLKL